VSQRLNVASDSHDNPVPHGVAVSCERYTWGSQFVTGSPSDVFVASSGFVHLYIYYALKKKSGGGGGKGNCTQVGNCTAVKVCWKTGIFSRSVGYIRISPECLLVNLNF